MTSLLSSRTQLLDELSNGDPQVLLIWFGGKYGDQDVYIRLVRDSINDEPEAYHDNAVVLAVAFIHSSRLMERSKLIRHERLGPKQTKDLLKVELHVDEDDIVPYIDCLTFIYNNFEMPPGYERFDFVDKDRDLKDTLKLLGAASHIGYVSLSATICHHLVLGIDWSREENLLVLVESQLRKEGMRHLFSRCCNCEDDSGRELIVQVLRRARVQDWRPTPTFEQKAVPVINEEFKRMLAEAHTDCEQLCEQATTLEGASRLALKLERICDTLQAMLKAQVASEGVRCLLQYSSIPRLLCRGVEWKSHDHDVMSVRYAFATTVASIYKELLLGHVVLGNSDRYALMKNWSYCMEHMKEYCRREVLKQFDIAQEAIFSSLNVEMRVKLLNFMADNRLFFTYG